MRMIYYARKMKMITIVFYFLGEKNDFVFSIANFCLSLLQYIIRTITNGKLFVVSGLHCVNVDKTHRLTL